MQLTENPQDIQEIINIILRLPENKLYELKKYLQSIDQELIETEKKLTILDLEGIWKQRTISPKDLRKKAQGL